MVDEALLQEFFTDTQSHLDGIEEAALKLEESPGQLDLIDEVFRRVHSIKGNAGMLGLNEIHEEGQEFETFLDGVRERGVAKPEEIEEIFHGLDRLKLVVHQVKGGDEVSPIVMAGEVEHEAPGIEPETPEEPEPEAGEGADDEPEPEAPVAAEAAPAPPVEVAVHADTHKTERQAAGDNELRTFLTFDLSGEKYGIDIMKVREIITTEQITRVPKTKGFVQGVMNLRDQVIPVFSLKKKLGIEEEEGEVHEEKNIIIIEISKLTTGLRVDEVTGIKVFPGSKISPPEALYGSVPTDYLLGIGQTEDEAVILLEVMDVCDPEEILF